jgi:hypothetical protein
MAEAMAAADAHAAARLSELSARTADAAAIAEHARQATPPPASHAAERCSAVARGEKRRIVSRTTRLRACCADDRW